MRLRYWGVRYRKWGSRFRWLATVWGMDTVKRRRPRCVGGARAGREGA